MRRLAMAAFRRLPKPIRRLAVHAGTPSYTVGAVALLRRDDGAVLLVEQRHSEGWALPGGLLRRREAPHDAVAREVAEEVGISLAPASLPVPVVAVNAHLRRVDLVYDLAVPEGEVARREDDAEVRRLGWFGLDALPDISDPTREILRGIRVL